RADRLGSSDSSGGARACSNKLFIGLLQLLCLLFPFYGSSRSSCLITLRIEPKLRIGQLPFHLGQRVVDTGACALKGEDRGVCAGCRICSVHGSPDQRGPPCFRCSLDFSSHRSAAGRKSLLSWPKPRNRPPQVGDWIIDLKHGCLLRFCKLATSRSQGVDRFAYFFATFAQMDPDRSNSQNRVSHAADLSTFLVSNAESVPPPVSSSGGSGGVPLRQLKDLVAQKRDYIIIRESYASFFIAGCCARAASGHAAAAPPSVAKNFRRPMWLAMVNLRSGVIHAMEGCYQASIAR